ncbi:MAG: hypothetical protein IJW52_01700 [Clostridia bacterium]|nr:hypothetical protein [Clostridia bacterium]
MKDKREETERREKISEALDNISSRHIEEAADFVPTKNPLSRKKIILRCIAVAACIAVVVGVLFAIPMFKNDDTPPFEFDTEAPLTVNLNYSIIEEDGKNYFVFDDPEMYAPPTIPDGFNISVIAPVAKFTSLKELIYYVNNGTLTEEQRRAIALFEKDENGRIKICDFEDMYLPRLPLDCTIGDVIWYGDSYKFNIEVTKAKIAYFDILSKEDYDRKLLKTNYTDKFSNPNITVISTEKDEYGKTITYYTTDAGYFKEIRYSYSEVGKELFIVEFYCLEANGSHKDLIGNYMPISDTIPSSVEILGIENGKYYEVSLFNFSEKSTFDWLISFGITKYVETE